MLAEFDSSCISVSVVVVVYSRWTMTSLETMFLKTGRRSESLCTLDSLKADMSEGRDFFSLRIWQDHQVILRQSAYHTDTDSTPIICIYTLNSDLLACDHFSFLVICSHIDLFILPRLQTPLPTTFP